MMSYSFFYIAILFILFILFIFPILFFLVKFFFNKKEIINFFQFIFYNYNISYFAKDSITKFTDKLMFLPHPFLNWSLNPNFKNKYGKFVHTNEGFRKTIDEKSIINYLKLNNKKYKIVCIGGSTTQCSDMENFEDTWPSLLNKNLNNKKIDSIVINFGVGAWTTIQSFIRCLTWFSKIKPDLLIFYHAKNDLTPLMNGSLSEESIQPDFQNIITQFGDRYNLNIPKLFLMIPLFLLFLYFFNFRELKKGLLGIYKPRAEQNTAGMKRFDKNYIESIIFRHKSIINLCEQINCKILYIPEIVIDGIYRDLLNDKLYPQIKKELAKYKNLDWYDIDKVIPKNNEYFWDKMHFTKKGNLIFSDLVASKIINNYFLNEK